MALLATRHGALSNMAELAAPLGVSVPTIGRWIDILEATGLILRVLPYFDNLGKRLIKSSKIYWSDSGLVCHLLGIHTPDALERSPFLGAIFEGAVAAEIAKAQINRGGRRELYYFRDQQGLEVDFIVPLQDGGMGLVEAKATHTPRPEMAKPMVSLARAWASSNHRPNVGAKLLVHRAARGGVRSNALAPEVGGIPYNEFVHALNGGPGNFEKRLEKPAIY
jgi:hypothetical protein